MALSFLGIFHTVIGLVAIGAAVADFSRRGKIDLAKNAGKIYFYLTLVTSITALGLSSVKGFNPGHALAVLIVLLISAAYFLFAKKPASGTARYFETFFLTFSFFLSMIPTINETLTRVPVGHPIAYGPADPVVAKTILLVFVLFVAGSILQFSKQRKINKLTIHLLHQQAAGKL